jgi:hypothetical protein
MLLLSYSLYEDQCFVPRITPRTTKANVVIIKDILSGLFIEHCPVRKCNYEPLLSTYRP